MKKNQPSSTSARVCAQNSHYAYTGFLPILARKGKKAKQIDNDRFSIGPIGLFELHLQRLQKALERWFSQWGQLVLTQLIQMIFVSIVALALCVDLQSQHHSNRETGTLQYSTRYSNYLVQCSPKITTCSRKNVSRSKKNEAYKSWTFQKGSQLLIKRCFYMRPKHTTHSSSGGNFPWTSSHSHKQNSSNLSKWII